MSRGEVRAAACALAVLVSARQGAPCAFVGEQGLRVRIAAEEALIVWDAARGTEHFIRRADFRRDGGGAFGFLVPAPSRPELAEADEGVFSRLANLYTAAPRRWRARGALGDDGGGRVQVVQITRVAGMNATVLRASDPQALAAWLRAHGFSSRPDLASWLVRYTTGEWHLTAFRYDGGARPSFGSRAVRLSFRAARPFYPYAEPADQTQHHARRLRVTVVAPWRAAGAVRDQPWPARVGYADRPALQGILRGAVPPECALGGSWVTTFEQNPSRRGGDDLYFVPAAEQVRVRASLPRYEASRALGGSTRGIGVTLE